MSPQDVFTLIFVFGGFVASCFIWIYVAEDKEQRTCITIPFYWLVVFIITIIMDWRTVFSFVMLVLSVVMAICVARRAPAPQTD